MNRLNHNSKGILQYWQPLIGIVVFVASGGIFYNKVESAIQKVQEIEKRQDRQFELYQGDREKNY